MNSFKSVINTPYNHIKIYFDKKLAYLAFEYLTNRTQKISKGNHIYDYNYINNSKNQQNKDVAIIITPLKQTYKSYVIEK